jgi:hypothetical protein
MRTNAISNKGEPRKILGGKNLTVARATFATVWIRACYCMRLFAIPFLKKGYNIKAK